MIGLLKGVGLGSLMLDAVELGEVEGVEFIDHFLDGKVFEDEFLAGVAELIAKSRIISQLEEARGDGLDIASTNEKASLAFKPNFSSAIEIIRDDRFGSGEGLRQSAGEGFAIGEMNETIHDTNVARDVSRRHEARENNLGRNAHLACACLELGAQWTVAQQKEASIRALGEDRFGGDQEVLMAFKRGEPGNLSDDESTSGKAELGSEGRIVSSSGKRFNRETAEDATVHLRCADACLEVQPGHGLSRANEMSGGAANDAFGSSKREVRESALERSEGGAVNMMNDNWNAGAASGEPTQKSGLAAVRVEDFGFAVSESSGEGPQCKEVFPGVNGSDEVGNDGENLRAIFEAGFHRAFGAGSGAGD